MGWRHLGARSRGAGSQGRQLLTAWPAPRWGPAPLWNHEPGEGGREDRLCGHGRGPLAAWGVIPSLKAKLALVD